MANSDYKYVWRCAKCTYHFSNIAQADGVVKQEKKCPKCKSINFLTLTNKEIIIQCRLFDRDTNGYEGQLEENYPYPE